MRTFAGNKPLSVIYDQCREQGLDVDDRLHQTSDSDYIVIQGNGNRVLYSTVNGRFFGVTPWGAKFSSDSEAYEHEPWFRFWLCFFYTD